MACDDAGSDAGADSSAYPRRSHRPIRVRTQGALSVPHPRAIVIPVGTFHDRDKMHTALLWSISSGTPRNRQGRLLRCWKRRRRR